jgi:hypothetical protein
MLRKPELASTKRCQKDEIMAAWGRTRDRLTKMSFDCSLDSHCRRKIETLKIHGGKKGRTCTWGLRKRGEALKEEGGRRRINGEALPPAGDSWRGRPGSPGIVFC